MCTLAGFSTLLGWNVLWPRCIFPIAARHRAAKVMRFLSAMLAFQIIEDVAGNSTIRLIENRVFKGRRRAD